MSLESGRTPAPVPQTYAINLIIRDKPVLVVGGGRVAQQKIKGLKAAGGQITMVSPTATDNLAADLTVDWIGRTYESKDLDGKFLVVTATGVKPVDALVADEARTRGVWVNSADDPQNCDFILPAIARAGDLSIAISTRGRSPGVATWLRKRMEIELDQRYQDLLDLASEVRAEVRAHHGTSELQGWGEGLDEAFDLIGSGDHTAAREALRQKFNLKSPVKETV